MITQHEKQTFLKLGHMQSVWVHHFVITRLQYISRRAKPLDYTTRFLRESITANMQTEIAVELGSGTTKTPSI